MHAWHKRFKNVMCVWNSYYIHFNIIATPSLSKLIWVLFQKMSKLFLMDTILKTGQGGQGARRPTITTVIKFPLCGVDHQWRLCAPPFISCWLDLLLLCQNSLSPLSCLLPWHFYLQGRLVNTVNCRTRLCHADQARLPRGQTLASHSGLG